MSVWRRVSSAIVLAFASFASAGAQLVDIETVNARIEKLMQRADMVGLAVVIVENNRIIHVKGYGVTNSDTGQAVTPDTVFRWASLSKAVAATALLKLEAESQIDLDAPAYFYAPSLHLPARKVPFRPASLRDILSQRSGLGRDAYSQKLEAREDPKTLRTALKTYPTRCNPGTCYSYQNVVFDAASEALETAAHTSYAGWVQAYIFNPLGMRTASFGRGGLRMRRHAYPHTIAGELDRKPNHNGYYRIPAAGGVNGSIRDLGRWMQANMGTKPDVISRDILRQSQRSRVRTAKQDKNNSDFFGRLQNSYYGMGWRTYDYGGTRLVGHRGLVRGYRSTILFDPAKGNGVAVLWNTPHRRPVGLPLEVFDIWLGLPAQDWMYLGGGPDTPPLPAARSEP